MSMLASPSSPLAFPPIRATIGLGVSKPSSGRKPTFLLDGTKRALMRPAITSKIEEIAERVAGSEGIEVVEVEVKGGGKNQFVRISIDKPEGVPHGDCELIPHH